ncbi:GrpB family protein [Staphylococcus nepalensis]|uniref:GrpB family protein n=1 Tax=Staphylococcus nepalensis TaxID=214473 RepID=UPI002D1E36FD|nr:GrpB family protein [Staphylococcus nepalensis]
MHSNVQLFIKDDVQQNFIKQYEALSHKLFNLLDTSIRSTHHIGGTSHFNYPTEPILDILSGVNHLHDITSLGEKRLIYEGFYSLHRPYNKKVIMAKFNNLIGLKQTVRLHIIQKNSNLYDDYLKTNDFL